MPVIALDLGGTKLAAALVDEKATFFLRKHVHWNKEKGQK